MKEQVYFEARETKIIASRNPVCQGGIIRIQSSPHPLCSRHHTLKIAHHIRSLMVSFQGFLCLPILRSPSTVSGRILLERCHDVLHVQTSQDSTFHNRQKWFLMACCRIYINSNKYVCFVFLAPKTQTLPRAFVIKLPYSPLELKSITGCVSHRCLK